MNQRQTGANSLPTVAHLLGPEDTFPFWYVISATAHPPLKGNLCRVEGKKLLWTGPSGNFLFRFLFRPSPKVLEAHPYCDSVNLHTSELISNCVFRTFGGRLH